MIHCCNLVFSCLKSLSKCLKLQETLLFNLQSFKKNTFEAFKHLWSFFLCNRVNKILERYFPKYLLDVLPCPREMWFMNIKTIVATKPL